MAAVAFAQSRAGRPLLGIGEPIIELTAIHYTYAGAGALMLAEAARRSRAGGAQPRLALAAVLLTAAAPPVVAIGFVSRSPVPQIGGAVLMTLGVWATASLQLAGASAGSEGRLLLVISGLAIWIPMVLAVAWAIGQHIDLPVLSIRDMARTHGVANAIGFTICGLLGRRLETGATHGRKAMACASAA